MRRISFMLIILFFFFLSLPVFGEGSHVLLQNLQGQVLYRGEAFYSRFAPADEMMTIYPGETIRVGPGGEVEILFPGGSIVLLKEDTEVRLQLDAKGELSLHVLSVTEGELVYEYDSFLDRIRIHVETPSAIAAVRGIPTILHQGEWGRSRVSLKAHVRMTLERNQYLETLSPVHYMGWEMVKEKEFFPIPWPKLHTRQLQSVAGVVKYSTQLYALGRSTGLLLSSTSSSYSNNFLQKNHIVSVLFLYLF